MNNVLLLLLTAWFYLWFRLNGATALPKFVVWTVHAIIVLVLVHATLSVGGVLSYD